MKMKIMKMKMKIVKMKMNIKTDEKVESKKEEDEDYENEDEDYENEYEDDDDETMSQNEIKEENDYLDKIIHKSKSFKDQIKSLEKVENLEEYWRFKKYGDKKLKFKLNVAYLSKIINEKLFE